MRSFVLSLTLSVAAFHMAAIQTAAAQVDLGQLNAAQSYDVGPLGPNNGGLEPSIWQGMSAARANDNITAINIGELSELPHMFMRRILLSASVPPQGNEAARADYNQAVVKAKLALGDYTALESLSNPQNPLQRQADFRANLALVSGDNDAACRESDREIDNRSAPFWMQMRIVCHVIRGEVPAAELTLNLMRDREDIDPDFIAVADKTLGLRKTLPDDISGDDPVILALMGLGGEDAASSLNGLVATALDNSASPDVRLAALFKTGRRLTPDQIKSVFNSLLFSNTDLVGGVSFDITSALAGLQNEATRSKSVAQLYNLATDFNNLQAAGQASAALLNFAESVDYVPHMTRLLSETLPFISAQEQAELDARRFAWAAVRRADLTALGGIYRALDPEDPLAGRIALTSDAMGNGFVLSELGLDIETRLAGNGRLRREAVRDSLIALALGARVSDAAASSFANYSERQSFNPVKLAQLNAAAKAGAQAEVLLSITAAMGARDVSDLSNFEVYSYISALSQVGLTREAGEMAAYDVLSRLPPPRLPIMPSGG